MHSKLTEGKKPTILVVDDEIDNVSLLKRTLRKEYNVLTATSGFEGLDILSSYEDEVALIISDQRMPGMTGTEFIEKSGEIQPAALSILLTGYSDIDAMIDGINKCELFQYVTKPWDPSELKVIVNQAIDNYQLSLTKKSLLKQLRELLYTTIQAISEALDEKDNYTHGHSKRVTLYSLILGRAMNLDTATLEKLQLAGLLHDIGKIGTPENILNKPGGLTHEEFDVIKKHPRKGKDILKNIKQLKEIAGWLRSHHEKFDGSGYPDALKGEEIPLPARILAVADTYDAMTSDRSYRKGLPHDVALEEIKRCAGTQFDPMVVDVFMKKEKFFREAKEASNTDQTFNEYAVIVPEATSIEF
ncbi:MAG: HD domain-containing phosphohydrolase [Vampirovibrionia bacterium]